MVHGRWIIPTIVLILVLGGTVLTAQAQPMLPPINVKVHFCSGCHPEARWEGAKFFNLGILDPNKLYLLATRPFCCNVIQTGANGIWDEPAVLEPSGANVWVGLHVAQTTGDSGVFFIHLYEDIDRDGDLDPNVDRLVSWMWGKTY